MQFDKLKPIADRVIVRPNEPIKQSRGGILIPDNVKDKPTAGVVIAAGPGRIDPETRELVPMNLKVGDKVFFARYQGLEVDWEGEVLKIFKEDELLATIED